MNSADPFDGLAHDYDSDFTRSCVGGLLRAAVWRRLEAMFQAGEVVLELNCGTGEDALHLASRGISVHATDASRDMVEVARAKVARSRHGQGVVVEQRRIEALDELDTARFDGALSNFGGLNCVEDLDDVARSLARLVKPGGRVMLCIMGPVCLWEWAWFLARAQPRKAVRRLAPGGSRWRGITIRYPTLARAERAFAGHFSIVRRWGLGALIPPSYAEPWARAHPRALAWLGATERRIETHPLVVRIADHYVLELEREVVGWPRTRRDE